MEWKAAATVRIRDTDDIRIRYAVLCWPSDHAHSQAIKLLYSVYIKNIQIGNSAPELPLLAHSGMKCTQCARHTHTSLTHTHVLIFLVYLYLFIVWPKSGPSISKTSRPLAVSLTHSPPYFLFQCMCAAASATRRMGALLFWINKASLKLRAKIPSKRLHTYAFWRVFAYESCACPCAADLFALRETFASWAIGQRLGCGPIHELWPGPYWICIDGSGIYPSLVEQRCGEL